MWDNFRSFKVSFKKKNGPESNYYVRQDVSCTNCSIKKCFLLFRASTFVDRLDVLYVCVCVFFVAGWICGGVVIQKHRLGRPDVHPILRGPRPRHSTNGRLRCSKVTTAFTNCYYQ